MNETKMNFSKKKKKRKYKDFEMERNFSKKKKKKRNGEEDLLNFKNSQFHPH
jgi:hypothetical protein